MTAPSIREAPKPHPGLKPCPFCGETRIFFNAPDKSTGFKGSINCPACGAGMPREINSDQELIDCWNTRAALSAPPQDVVEGIAETLWRAEYRRATGKERGIAWDDVAESDQNKYRHSATAILASGLVTASRPSREITMSDVRLVAGEGKLSAHDVLAAVNAHLRLHPIGPDETAIRADERERCAQIAEDDERQDEWPKSVDVNRTSPSRIMQQTIAAAIRSGGGE